MAQAEPKQGRENIIKIIRFIYLPNKCILLELKKQLQFMFNLKWMFANQGLNQDDPAQFGYRAQFESLFTHVIILLICSVFLVYPLQVL
jgi:hypothetical protein